MKKNKGDINTYFAKLKLKQNMCITDAKATVNICHRHINSAHAINK